MSCANTRNSIFYHNGIKKKKYNENLNVAIPKNNSSQKIPYLQ